MQGPKQPRRLIPLLFLCLAAIAFATGASVSASPKTPRTDTFRFGTTGASVQFDPALAYITTAWEVEYATCAKLINYPDTPWDEREASRLRPEIAAAMPTISADQRTYTFQIRNDFQFSPPDNSFVTAQSMKYTFERTLSHNMASPASQFFTNIVGEVEYNNGQANEITGIVASGDTLTIQLIQPQGDFLTFLAMPFTCAVPIGLPPVEQLGPIPSAGPYYISDNTINQHTIASRNPNYHGPRPQRFDALEYDWNLNEETAYQQVLSGELDEGPLPAAHVQEVADLYGPDSPAAARGLQQFFVEPQNCVGYMPLNTERPTFADVNMRKAVNYAVDRTAYGDQAGRTRRHRSTVAPAGHAGVRRHRRLPRSSGPRAGARPRGLAPRRSTPAHHRLLPLERDDQPGAVSGRQEQPRADRLRRDRRGMARRRDLHPHGYPRRAVRPRGEHGLVLGLPGPVGLDRSCSTER